MVNQIQKRRDNASIHWPGVGFLLASPLPPLVFSSLPLAHSFTSSLSLCFLSLPLPSFSPSSFPPLLHFHPLLPGNRNGVVMLVSGSPFNSPPLRRRQQQVALPWRLHRVAGRRSHPEQCRAECGFLALFRALFPSNGASGLQWALHLDTTTIPTPSLSPSPAFPSSLHVFDLLKIKRTKSQRKVGFCCVCHRTRWGSSNAEVEPRSDDAAPGWAVTTGQTGQLCTRGRAW